MIFDLKQSQKTGFDKEIPYCVTFISKSTLERQFWTRKIMTVGGAGDIRPLSKLFPTIF